MVELSFMKFDEEQARSNAKKFVNAWVAKASISAGRETCRLINEKLTELNNNNFVVKSDELKSFISD